MADPITAPPFPDPHAGADVLHAGAALGEARAVVILLHGRGGSAKRTLEISRHFPGDDVCYFSPAAAEHSWYPQRFLAPLAENEPALRSALRVVSALVDRAAEARIGQDRVLIGGFSQGGCLALEWALRTGGRVGGIFALSSAVMGAPGSPRPFDRDLPGTPVLLACGDADNHIPIARVKETGEILRSHGAMVTERIYPGLGHIIVSDELKRIGRMILSVRGRGI